MTAGSIVEVDPSTLTIALNVRTDAKVDKEFIASIKELGVLQPPMVTAAEGGGYEVVLGQRRALAAVEAGLKVIPVYLVDKDEAGAARIVDQLTENDQRQQLTESERVGGYKQLALIGISPAQIAKRTSTSRKRVDSALIVADSEVAVDALGKFEITLDQAAEIVEFQDDKAAVKRLTDTAESNPGQLPHVLRDLREKRGWAEVRAVIEAEIAREKVELLAYTEWDGQGVEGFSKLDLFASPKDNSEPLTPALVKDKSLLGARAVKGWRDGNYQVTKQYLIRDGHPFERLVRVVQQMDFTPDQQAAADQLAAEQQVRRERTAQREAANEVRRAWLVTELMQRTKLPDPTPFLAVLLATDWLGLPPDDDLTWSLLGLVTPDGEDPTAPEPDEFLLQHLASTPSLAPKIVMAAAIMSMEADFARYNDPSGSGVVRYLEHLAEWGYGLSDYEASLIAALKEPAAA